MCLVAVVISTSGFCTFVGGRVLRADEQSAPVGAHAAVLVAQHGGGRAPPKVGFKIQIYIREKNLKGGEHLDSVQNGAASFIL